MNRAIRDCLERISGWTAGDGRTVTTAVALLMRSQADQQLDGNIAGVYTLGLSWSPHYNSGTTLGHVDECDSACVQFCNAIYFGLRVSSDWHYNGMIKIILCELFIS